MYLLSTVYVYQTFKILFSINNQILHKMPNDNFTRPKRRKAIEPSIISNHIKDFFLEKKGTATNPIPNKRVLMHLFGLNITLRPYDIREHIHIIRTKMVIEVEGIRGFICANNKGYYLSFDRVELEDYKARLISRQRKEEEVITALGL